MAYEVKKPTVFGGFSGIRNTVDTDRFAPDELEIAKNLDLDDSKKAICRAGWGTVKTAGYFRSGWSDGPDCLALTGTDLVRVNPDYSTTVLATVGATDRMSVARAPGRIYWMTDTTKGCIQGGVNRSWGVAAPVFSIAALPGGALPPGDYRVTVAMVVNGQESPVRPGMKINCSGGIRVTLPAGEKNVYCTGPDGAEYGLAGESTTSMTFDIVGVPVGAEPETLFCVLPPQGQLIAYWRGRMLIAQGDVLWFTPAYRLEVVRPDQSFVKFGERINVIAPFDGGVFIGTNQRHFLLNGTDPSKWQPVVVADYGAIFGTLAANRSSPGQDGTDGQVPTPVWSTPQGVVMGKAGGLVNVTENRFRFGEWTSGSGAIRENNGYRQYLTVVR